jgi:hypothetical protein
MVKPEYDFERIGMEATLSKLQVDIKGKSDYLQSKNISTNMHLKTLLDIEKMARDSYNILKELQNY